MFARRCLFLSRLRPPFRERFYPRPEKEKTASNRIAPFRRVWLRGLDHPAHFACELSYLRKISAETIVRRCSRWQRAKVFGQTFSKLQSIHRLFYPENYHASSRRRRYISPRRLSPFSPRLRTSQRLDSKNLQTLSRKRSRARQTFRASRTISPLDLRPNSSHPCVKRTFR